MFEGASGSRAPNLVAQREIRTLLGGVVEATYSPLLSVGGPGARSQFLPAPNTSPTVAIACEGWTELREALLRGRVHRRQSQRVGAIRRDASELHRRRNPARSDHGLMITLVVGSLWSSAYEEALTGNVEAFVIRNAVVVGGQHHAIERLHRVLSVEGAERSRRRWSSSEIDQAMLHS